MTPIILESPTPPVASPGPGVDRESLVLDGLDLNDGATRTLVGLEFAPAKKLLEWIKSADSDGSKLLRMARHENSEFDLRLFIRGTDRDDVLDTVGGVIDKLQEAERQSANGGRGLELVWSPMGSSYSYTFYLLAGESNLLRAEDFYKLGKPHLDVKLYTSPFGYGPEVSTSTASSSLPLLTMTVANVPGDVPAECRIRVLNGSVFHYDYVAAGLQNLSYAAVDLLTDSAAFITSGYSGSQTTRTGAYSANGVVRATLTTNPVAVCGSAELTHIGTYRNIFRLWPSSTNVSVRMAWRQGRDPWTAEPWVQAPFEDNFWEVDLGQSKIRTNPLGTQTWQWRIEAKSTASGDTLDVDYHILLPSGEGFAKSRSIPSYETPTTFTVRDEFDQTAGALVGKTAPVGGVWAGAGDADDFAVETTWHTAQRTAVSDASTDPRSGRINFLGSDMAAKVVEGSLSSSASSPTHYVGLVARYVNINNFLVASLYPHPAGSSLFVSKLVTGTESRLFNGTVAGTSPGAEIKMRLAVTVEGVWGVWLDDVGMATGLDSSLATGGALAVGKPGIFDWHFNATAITRNFDNFFAFVPPVDTAIFPGRTLEFRSYGDDPALRADSSGIYYGAPSETRGGRMWLPPAGSEGRTTRIAIMARQNDIEVLPSASVTDPVSAEVIYRPRWINVPRQG